MSSWLAVVGIVAALNPSPKDLRAQFHKMLDRPKVALAPVIAQTETRDGLIIERGRFQSEATEAVPFIVYKPATATGRIPAVVVLHGTGGSKENQEGDLRELARRGILGIAIDARFHGERIPGGAHGSTEYQAAITRAWREKDAAKRAHPFYYDTVYDLWRTADYLQSRSDVDGKRLGIFGYSMGGIETWLTAGTDERYRVVVPAISVQSFRWSLENEQWQGRANSIGDSHKAAAADLGEPTVNAAVCRALWGAVIPGILDEFDCPRMLEAIAPRPLLIVGGDKDPNCPYGGAQIAIAAADAAYAKAKASDRLEHHIAPGIGHAVTPELHQKAIDWLVRWLKP